MEEKRSFVRYLRDKDWSLGDILEPLFALPIAHGIFQFSTSLRTTLTLTLTPWGIAIALYAITLIAILEWRARK